MSSERLDVSHLHEEFPCPDIRGWFCGWSVKFVRGRRSLSYSRMIGRIIVVQICWTQIGLLFFAFFQMVWHDCCCLVICWVRLVVVWFVSPVLAVWHFVLLYGSSQNVLFHMCQMMISTRFRFPWRRVHPSGVEFRVLLLRVTVGVVCDARRTEQRCVWSS